MSAIVVRGGNKLSGKVRIHGAKNAVLPIIAASILAQEGVSRIADVPRLDDVLTMKELLVSLGCDIRLEGDVLLIDSRGSLKCEAPFELVKKMRASFLVLGPLLARFGYAQIPLPGGCAIGTRPIDQHLKGLEAMGAEIELGQGYIAAKAHGKLHGAQIYLDVPSVGATENLMMAAALAEGTTYIENAAMEPEIVDLANFLNGMGARIRGAGTGVIRIDGVDRLTGCAHTVIPDRIVAGTYMIAAAITGGDLFVEGAIGSHLRPLISKLREMGVAVDEEEQGIRVSVPGPLRTVDIKTLPHPGFPTDLQAQMMALLMVAEGTGIVTETVFENRFMHVDAFRRMNGDIQVDGRMAVVKGGAKLKGCKVCATDLRAGAALILAGLAAEGETEITGVHHIERGYVDIVGELSRLGAEIKTVEQPEAETEAENIGIFAVQPTLA